MIQAMENMDVKGNKSTTTRTPEVLSTTDYSMFKKIRGNRKVSPYHVKTLSKSVGESNLMSLNPIIVNHKMEIIDGQHRFEVSKRNHLPVYYMQAEFATLEDVTLLNANLRPWKTIDYLESFVSRGFDDYIKLQEYTERNGISISISMQLLANDVSNKKESNLMQLFKSGEFKISTQEFADEMAQKLLDLKPYTDGDIWKSRDFIRALLSAYKYVDHEDLLKKFQEQSAFITRRGNALGYIRVFEDLYNFKLHTKVRFY